MASKLNSLSSYPNGFTHGVAIRGIPVVNAHGGNIYWVDSNTGADSTGNDGSRNRPFATADYAIGRCTANNGDIIILAPGHAETLAAAGAITADVAGVSIVGMGEGDDRPILTFSATASTILVSAASFTMQNVIVKPSIDSVVTAFNVQASDCWLDFTLEDASDTIEFVRGVTTTADADDLYVKIRYKGRTGGNACVNAVRLVGSDRVRVDLDCYGIFSTAAVEFLTTACTDVTVTGYVYNSGTTDGSKLVVDTATGSTWFADIYDGGAGARYSGGSGSALASDDVSSVSAAVAVIDGFHDVPTADVATNAQMRDVVGNKTDAAATGAVSAVESLMAYAKQLVTEGIARDAAIAVIDEFHDVPAADATANAQINEVIGNKTDAAVLASSATASMTGYLKGLLNSTVRTIEKTDGAVLSGADPLFTITGGPIHVLSIIGVVTTGIGGAANGTLRATVTTPAGDVALSTTVAIDTDAAGTVYTFLGPTGVLTPTTAGASILDVGHATLAPSQFIVPIGNINFLGSAAQTGVIAWYMAYMPLSPAAVVTAAA